MIVAEGAYTCLRPGIVAASALTGSIKNAGNLIIGHQSSELPDNIGRLGIEGPAVLTIPWLNYLELRVITTLPVQNQVNLFVRNGCNNLDEKGSQDPFAGLRCRCGMVPSALKVRAKPQKLGPLRFA